MAGRLVRTGDALSQLLNVVIFDGDPNHSISGDAYRFRRKRLQWLIDAVFSAFEKDHCRKAFEHDVEKARRLMTEVAESAFLRR